MLIDITLASILTKSQIHQIINGTPLMNVISQVSPKKLIGTNWESKADWTRLVGKEWRTVLLKKPELSAKCDWSKLNMWEIVEVVRKHPQFSSKLRTDEMTGSHWVWLLEKQPQFADKCDWSKLSTTDWDRLIKKRPEFTDCWAKGHRQILCTNINWNKITHRSYATM